MNERRHDRKQRGAALLTAMIIVALIAVLASSMLWQQWRAVQVEAAERSRVQSAWILSGALDWARLILREDPRSGKKSDDLGEPWAVPLAEARLSTFLAADKSNADDAPEAFLSGAISDAQARYNVNNLVAGGSIVPEELATLQRLCEYVGVSADVAGRIASGLRDASPPSAPSAGASAAAGEAAAPAATDPPLKPRSVAQLAWLGIDGESLRTLEPYIVLLPARSLVNINTASSEVIAAAMGLDLATAGRIVQKRQSAPFESGDVEKFVPGLPKESLLRVDVKSSFFEVRGRLRLGDLALEQRSLVQRMPNNSVTVLHRERVSSHDTGGS